MVCVRPSVRPSSVCLSVFHGEPFGENLGMWRHFSDILQRHFYSPFVLFFLRPTGTGFVQAELLIRNRSSVLSSRVLSWGASVRLSVRLSVTGNLLEKTWECGDTFADILWRHYIQPFFLFFFKTHWDRFRTCGAPYYQS